jgi:hypothetical protein
MVLEIFLDKPSHLREGTVPVRTGWPLTDHVNITRLAERRMLRDTKTCSSLMWPLGHSSISILSANSTILQLTTCVIAHPAKASIDYISLTCNAGIDDVGVLMWMRGTVVNDA